MTRDEFHQLALLHGADLARWPDDRRAAATRLAAEPWAAGLLADLAEVERALIAADVDAPSPDRVGRAIAATLGRINDAPARSRRGLASRQVLAWLMAGAGGFAASATLGMVLALYGPLAAPTIDPVALLVESGDLSLLVSGLGG